MSELGSSEVSGSPAGNDVGNGSSSEVSAGASTEFSSFGSTGDAELCETDTADISSGDFDVDVDERGINERVDDPSSVPEDEDLACDDACTFQIEESYDGLEIGASDESVESGYDDEAILADTYDVKEADFSEVNVPEKTRPESEKSDASEISRKVDGLDQTNQETHTLENGNTLFDDPERSGQRLNYDQGNAVEGYQGTCGLCSCENVTRLSGKDVTEADAVDIAERNGWCEKGHPDAGDNGGTTALDRQSVLSEMGVDSEIDANLDRNHIADQVESGKGVIVSVDAGTFWEDPDIQGSHAVTVTSVERDANGDVCAFYVCDSGSGNGDYARRVDAAIFDDSLTGRPMNVTTRPIR